MVCAQVQVRTCEARPDTLESSSAPPWTRSSQLNFTALIVGLVWRGLCTRRYIRCTSVHTVYAQNASHFFFVKKKKCAPHLHEKQWQISGLSEFNGTPLPVLIDRDPNFLSHVERQRHSTQPNRARNHLGPWGVARGGVSVSEHP